MRLRVSDDGGFTLAEMMVAIGILTIATTAIIALMVTNVRMSASAMSRSSIVNAGNSYIERVRALPFEQITSSSVTSSTVTVNGYDVVIVPAVTWVDDPNIAGAQNYKRLLLDITGTAPGRPDIELEMEALIRSSALTEALKPSIDFASGSPDAQQVVFGTDVQVGATATAKQPGASITTMNYYVDGVPMRSTLDTAQWSTSGSPVYRSINWNTTVLDDDGEPYSPDGTRSLKIQAWDSNQREAYRVRQVLVDNHAPSPVSALDATSLTASQVRLSWAPTFDGTDSTAAYRFEIRRQINSVTSPWDTDGWQKLTAQAFTATSSPADFSATPLTRYEFRINARSPRGLEGTTADTAAVAITRPSMTGSFANTKSGSNYVGTVTLQVGGPTFTCASQSAMVYRSASPNMSSPTAFAMTWDNTTSSWRYTDTLPSTKSGSPAYYYRATVTLTPQGYQGGTTQSLNTQVLGPNHPTNASGPMPLVGW